jgi:uncharacterized membrane protein YbhN (UPF0104 family)
VSPFDPVRQAIGRVSLWTWTGCVIIFFAGHYLNAVKLWWLLGSDRGLLRVCVRAQYAGLSANLALPGLSGGDLVRAAYVVPAAGLARATAASLADRIVDTATVVVLVAAAWPIAGAPPAIAAMMADAGPAVAIGLAVATAGAAVLWTLPATARIRRQATAAFASVAVRPGPIVRAAVLSLAVQSAFVLANVWLARSAGVTTALAAWFVAWPLSKLVAVLPISLGGIGVREAALVALLAPYGAPRDAVLASGLLWQAVLIVTGVVGLVATQLAVRPPAGSAGR